MPRKKDPNSLTPKQLKFCEAVVKDGLTGKAAAVAAGYSEGSASQQAYALSNNPAVKLKIAQMREEREESQLLWDSEREYAQNSAFDRAVRMANQETIADYLDDDLKPDLEAMRRDRYIPKKIAVKEEFFVTGQIAKREYTIEAFDPMQAVAQVGSYLQISKHGMVDYSAWRRIHTKLEKMGEKLEEGSLALDEWLLFVLKNSSAIFADPDKTSQFMPIFDKVNSWLERAEKIELNKVNVIQLKNLKDMFDNAHQHYSSLHATDADMFRDEMLRFFHIIQPLVPEMDMEKFFDDLPAPEPPHLPAPKKKARKKKEPDGG